MAERPKNYEPRRSNHAGTGVAGARVLPRRRAAPKAPFSIVIPPPNVTGSLHMGHALTATIQDILIRWQRMAATTRSGCRAPITPASPPRWSSSASSRRPRRRAATTSAARSSSKRVWEWKEKYGERIVEQLKVLGASLDWDRERFTMDEGVSAAVREVFVRLHEEGLIYRAQRLINWCPSCHTALSDLEVEHEEGAQG